MASYQEVNVLLWAGRGDKIGVRAQWGQSIGNSEFVLPPNLTSAGLSSRILGATRAIDPDPAEAPADDADTGPGLEDIGVALFEAIFNGQAESVLQQAIDASQARVDGGVRIRLAMDIGNQDMLRIAGTPWELLWRKGDDWPLVVSNTSALVRTLDDPSPIARRSFKPPLKILVTMSNPIGSEPLNLTREFEALGRAWGHSPNDVVIKFAPPYKKALLKMLHDEAQAADKVGFHAVHYMGHGDFNAEAGGMLLFETGEGDRSPLKVSGSEFALWLKDHRPELVFLNACKTATMADGSAPNPVAGVASALVLAGIPAVVAMQFPISDPAAVIFSKTFYDRVAHGAPVDMAVAEARKLLYPDGSPDRGGQSPTTNEWATPVLFLRVDDGNLFISEEAAAAATAAPPRYTWASAPDTALRIFVAACTENVDAIAAELVIKLRGEEDAVVETSPPFDADYTTAVAALTARADLSIHILGDTPGKNAGDAANRLLTYPLEALRIGREAARPQIVVVSETDRVEVGGAYKSFVDKLFPTDAVATEAAVIDDADPQRATIVSTSGANIVEDVLARVNALRTDRSKEAMQHEVKRKIFVDAHFNDAEPARRLVDLLNSRGFTANMSNNDRISPDLDMIDAAMRDSTICFIVDNNVDREWVRFRRSALTKAITESRTPVFLGRYIPPVGDGSLDRSRFTDFNALNNSKKRWFDEIFPEKT